MIEVRYKAQLGNNMFQYCLGRILAEDLGFCLKAEPIPGFPNTAQNVGGTSHETPAQVLTGHLVDLDGVVTDRRPRKVLLDGWFQRHEYYRPHREKIGRWLVFDPGIRVPDENPDVVIHVRRTDYVRLGWALPFSFYEQALRHLLPRGGQVWILTDDKRDPFFKNFKPWRPIFASGSALEDMRFMSKARRLVMSQSTFSWWPTFLGNPQEVVCPVPSFGAWSAAGEASDATLIERDRFLCLECPEPYRPTGEEARHQQWRALRRRVVLGLNRRLGMSLPEPPR